MKCIKCEKEFDGGGPICVNCYLLHTERHITCDNCGREFATDIIDYEVLLDSCPYCGKNENGEEGS